MLGRFLRDEAGASAAEYAMLLILFGCVMVFGAIALSSSIGGGMTRFADVIDPADPSGGGGSGSTGGNGGSSSGGTHNGCGHGQASQHNPNCPP